MNKVIMNSLPTREKPCVDELYLKCLARKVNEIAQDKFQCNLKPLLPPNKAKESCANDVAKYILDLWSNAIASLDQFEDCLNIQPCSQVIYSTRTHTENVKVHPGGNQGPGGHPQPPHARVSARSPFQLNGDSESIIYLTFENDLVQVIEDQYVYSFMGIFSEIGGAVGILVGMSVMTIVEYLLMLHKKAVMLKTHLQKASNVVQKIEPNSKGNDFILMKDNRGEFQPDEQDKNAKTLGDTFKTNFSVSRRSSMISKKS